MKFQIVKNAFSRSVGKSSNREKQIDIINNLELEIQNLSDSQIQEKVQKLINIEESRRDEFDLRIQNSEDISSRESARQDEFDIVNNPEVIKKEIEEREIKPLITREERDRMMESGEGPQEVRFIDGQRVNVPVKYDFVKPKFSGLALKLSELPIEERSEFIEQNEIDEKILKQLDIPMSREEEKKRFNSEERFIKKRGK